MPNEPLGILKIFPEMRNPNTINTLCSIGRQIAYRLDQIAVGLGEEIVPGMAVGARPGARMDYRELEELLRMSLASYPRDHSEITVTDTRTPLVENKSMQRAARVLVTNNDGAHLLFYGNSTCGVGKAPVIQPEQSLPVTLPVGRTLFGIVGTGLSITVAVSVLELP